MVRERSTRTRAGARAGPERVRVIALVLSAALVLAVPAYSQDGTSEPFDEEVGSTDIFGDDDDGDIFNEEPEDTQGLPGETAETAASVSEDGYTDLGGKAFDLIVVRPLGVTRILMGVVCFIPAAIFAELPPFLGGDSERYRRNVGDVWRFFVMETVEATFTVPLGEFTDVY